MSLMGHALLDLRTSAERGPGEAHVGGLGAVIDNSCHCATQLQNVHATRFFEPAKCGVPMQPNVLQRFRSEMGKM